jgi:hypothetical protein
VQFDCDGGGAGAGFATSSTTVLPGSRSEPTEGFVPNTEPAGADEVCFVMTTLYPAFSSRERAALADNPETPGTFGKGCATTSVMDDPFSNLEPARSETLSTVPGG